jgi:hypothetical protein
MPEVMTTAFWAPVVPPENWRNRASLEDGNEALGGEVRELVEEVALVLLGVDAAGGPREDGGDVAGEHQA